MNRNSFIHLAHGLSRGLFFCFSVLQDQGKTRNTFEGIINIILSELFKYNIRISNKNNNSDSDKSDNSEEIKLMI